MDWASMRRRVEGEVLVVCRCALVAIEREGGIVRSKGA